MQMTTRPGGRTQRTRTAVLDATFAITSEAGYAGLSIESIAERSGVHKTTIYRRWGSVDAVLFDAIMARARSAIPLEATGDARIDLISMARSVADNLEDPVARAVAGAVLSRTDDGALRQLSDAFWDARISRAAELVQAGQRDGQIEASVDPALVVERIVGPIWFRAMVMRLPIDEGAIEKLVDAAIR
jgi:AcrR family transcriptional regulator